VTSTLEPLRRTDARAAEITPLHDVATPEAHAARSWLGLAVLSLIIAGCLSLLLVVARMPPFDRLVTDPLFFRRCLVVHVVLALVFWLYAFVAGLSFTLPAAGTSARASRRAHHLGLLGLVALVASALVPRAQPVLANYIPVIDHGLFIAGLVLFAAGVLLAVTDRRLMDARPHGRSSSPPSPSAPRGSPGPRGWRPRFSGSSRCGAAGTCCSWPASPP
jgi:hypothetical protein